MTSNYLNDLVTDPNRWPTIRDLITTEQVCTTRVALLYQQHPDFGEYMLKENNQHA